MTLDTIPVEPASTTTPRMRGVVDVTDVKARDVCEDLQSETTAATGEVYLERVAGRTYVVTES